MAHHSRHGSMPGKSLFRIHPLDAAYSVMAMPTGSIRWDIYSFFFLTAGEVLVQVGQRTIHLHASSALFIMPGEEFTIRFYSDCAGFMGGFHPDYIPTLEGQNALRSFSFLRSKCAHILHFDSERMGWIGALCQRLFGLMGDVTQQELTKTYLVALLSEMEHTQPQTESEANGEHSTLCNRFVEMVFEQSNQSLPIGYYADRLCISAVHLNKLVKKITGRTPLSWINEAVMAESKALLIQTDLPVNDIATRVGIEDASYFTRLFKKQIGITPTDFRKSKKVPL